MNGGFVVGVDVGFLNKVHFVEFGFRVWGGRREGVSVESGRRPCRGRHLDLAYLVVMVRLSVGAVDYFDRESRVCVCLAKFIYQKMIIFKPS